MEGVPRKSVCHPRHHLFHLYNSIYINGAQGGSKHLTHHNKLYPKIFFKVHTRNLTFQ